MRTILKVAILGLGTVSYIHQIAIEQSGLAEIVAVCDTNPGTHTEYKNFKFYNDLEEMLINEELDAVHVCLPHDMHIPAAEIIARHGVHVFLEKPIGISYKESAQFANNLQNKGIKVGVCFQNRYNITIEGLKNLLADDGEVLAVKALVTWFRPKSYYEAQPWRGQLKRAGGGVIINQAIHSLDLIQYLAGSVTGCHAQLSQLLDYDIEVEDTAVANFEFENGAQGFFMATNSYYENSTIEIQVITQRNKYLIKNNRLYKYDSEGDISFICEDELLDGYKSYYGQGHKLAAKAFYKAIIDDNDSFISVEDGLETMLMVDMMKLSSEESRLVKAKELRI